MSSGWQCSWRITGQHHRFFFTDAPAEDTDLLLSVLLECRARREIVSIIIGDDMITAA